jgi:hypothetical protein
MSRSRSVRAEDARRARMLARRRLGPEYGLRAAMVITADYAKPGNPQAHWWNREKLGLWLPPLSADNPAEARALGSGHRVRVEHPH